MEAFFRFGCLNCKILFVAAVMHVYSGQGLLSEEEKQNTLGVEEKAPPAKTHYLGREIAQTMHWTGAGWLTRFRREREESSAEMLRQLNLKPGQAVCDMGCGNGFHTLPMAISVGDKGKVYAVDIQQKMLEFLQKRAAEKEISHIESVLGKVHDPCLPEESIDLLLMVDVYHEFSHPVLMLQGIAKALRPGGQLVLVEFRKEDDEVPIKPNHKMSKEQMRKERLANGFVEVRSYDKLPWQHMMFFEYQGLNEE